jgi:hypothetical protein
MRSQLQGLRRWRRWWGALSARWKPLRSDSCQRVANSSRSGEDGCTVCSRGLGVGAVGEGQNTGKAQAVESSVRAHVMGRSDRGREQGRLWTGLGIASGRLCRLRSIGPRMPSMAWGSPSGRSQGAQQRGCARQAHTKTPSSLQVLKTGFEGQVSKVPVHCMVIGPSAGSSPGSWPSASSFIASADRWLMRWSHGKRIGLSGPCAPMPAAPPANVLRH